jgi:hypothetical protein
LSPRRRSASLSNVKLIGLLLALVLLSAAPALADQVKPNDYCYAVLGYESDGGPWFVIADEKRLDREGVLVGPPLDLVPPNFVPVPSADPTYEYRGTIPAGENALNEAGFKGCSKPIG